MRRSRPSSSAIIILRESQIRPKLSSTAGAFLWHVDDGQGVRGLSANAGAVRTVNPVGEGSDPGCDRVKDRFGPLFPSQYKICADLSVSVSAPSCAQHALRSLRTLKIPCYLHNSTFQWTPYARGHVQCCFTSTETITGRGDQDGHLDFHRAPELWGYRETVLSL